MVKIMIINNRRNELLKRNEIVFKVLHEKSSTPSRLEMRSELAKALKTDIEKVYIRKIESMAGFQIAVGEAHVYDSVELAKIIEPEHILQRNTPKKEEGK